MFGFDPSCSHDLNDDNCDCEPAWTVIYEIYTQPRLDYFRARLYHVYDMALFKARIDPVIDWFWERRGLDPDDFMPPSVERDCKCYSLDIRNQTVVGRVTIPREGGL